MLCDRDLRSSLVMRTHTAHRAVLPHSSTINRGSLSRRQCQRWKSNSLASARSHSASPIPTPRSLQGWPSLANSCHLQARPAREEDLECAAAGRSVTGSLSRDLGQSCTLAMRHALFLFPFSSTSPSLATRRRSCHVQLGGRARHWRTSEIIHLQG